MQLVQFALSALLASLPMGGKVARRLAADLIRYHGKTTLHSYPDRFDRRRGARGTGPADAGEQPPRGERTFAGPPERYLHGVFGHVPLLRSGASLVY